MNSVLIKTVALLGIMSMLSGCSFSYSSGASSDSSKSSSASSAPSTADLKTSKNEYAKDVSAYTSVIMAKGFDAKEYMRELSSIAKQHGVTDWENNSTTYTAIGTGLRRAGITQEEVGNVFFIKDLIAKKKNALVLILESYQN